MPLPRLNAISILLVGIQLVCLGFIGFSAPLICIRVDLQIWELSGLFLSISSLVSLGRKSFSVFPEPKSKGIFVRKGIYAFIRHPMYAGVLMVSLCLVWQYPTLERWISLFILIIVFVLKIIREETYLIQKYKEYTDYQQQTNRLIPFIW